MIELVVKGPQREREKLAYELFTFLSNSGRAVAHFSVPQVRERKIPDGTDVAIIQQEP